MLIFLLFWLTAALLVVLLWALTGSIVGRPARYEAAPLASASACRVEDDDRLERDRAA
jgi:hypothetical protein